MYTLNTLEFLVRSLPFLHLFQEPLNNDVETSNEEAGNQHFDETNDDHADGTSHIGQVVILLALIDSFVNLFTMQDFRNDETPNRAGETNEDVRSIGQEGFQLSETAASPRKLSEQADKDHCVVDSAGDQDAQRPHDHDGKCEKEASSSPENCQSSDDLSYLWRKKRKLAPVLASEEEAELGYELQLREESQQSLQAVENTDDANVEAIDLGDFQVSWFIAA